MEVSQKILNEFKEIFEKEHGVKYSNMEAREVAERLAVFFELLIKIDQKNKQKNDK